MIKDEFGFIKKNKLIMLSVMVIMIIPFLYCVFFLKSVWDPYGDTQALPVAVVNNDHAVQYQGKTLDVGDQTVKKLKKNHELGWRFVTAKQAAKGLKDNKYYTVVTIPSNFSKNAATLLDENPKKMQLTYKTNDSLNYLSQVISGIGVDKLDKEIRANVTNAYASAIFDQIKTVGKGFKEAASGATQLNEGTVKLDDGIDTYTVGVSKVHDGIQTMSLKVSPLTSQMNQAAAGATKLSNGLTTYTNGVGTLANGINTMATSVAPMGAKVPQLVDGIGKYTAGTEQLGAGLTEFQTKTATLPERTKALQQGVVDYTGGVGQLSGYLDQLNQNVSAMPASVDELKAGADTLATNADKVESALKELKSIATANQTAFDADYAATIQALNEAGVTPDSAAYQAVVTLHTNQTDRNKAELKTLNSISLNRIILNTAAKKIQAGVNDKLVPKTTELTAAVAKISDGASQLNEKSPELTNGVNELVAKVPEIITAIQQLNNGANQLNAKNAELNAGVQTLGSSVPTLLAGVQQLQNGGQQLTANSSALTSGSNELATKLTAGAAQLPQLTDGVAKLLDGTTQLTNNSGQLTDGIGQLNDGSKLLAKELKSGAKQVNGINLTDKTADMMAAPTKVNHTFFSKVANYGHALAPYVLSLALYVGALVFNFAYPIRKVSREDGTATQWFASKVVLGGLVATGMALIEATLIMAFGMTVQHVGLFYLFAWLFAMASMYLVMFLSMWLDNPGRFVAMVLLMLQLGGAGGTFPMEITNGFYNAIHPFLPMSYSIMGFRQALTSGIASGTVNGAIGFLLGVIVVSLALLWVVMQWLQKKHLMGVSQLDDNQKLQAVEK
ncbi:YhgE/Pip domain-containing protein [Lacticaseibacillus daqingensis]|uniref:YhgE/Pip domain-containing protein n=1 Tax=Lacticaseibacillus daqingensis TaxID=2486014 RepID=UPI000F76A275|nr:YhgE/Pip domain-containing protein [Lacticaseibacillus daqingensis]